MNVTANVPPIWPARFPVCRHRFTHSAETTPAPTNGLMAAQSRRARTSKKEKGTANPLVDYVEA